MQPTIHIVGYRISRTTALVLGAHPVNTQLDQQALVQALRRQLGLYLCSLYISIVLPEERAASSP